MKDYAENIDFATFQQDAEALHAEKVALKVECHSLKAQLEQEFTEGEETKAKLEKLEADAKTLKMWISEGNVIFDRLRSELDNHRASAARLETTNAQLTSDLDSANKEIGLLTANNHPILQNIVDLRNSDSDLQARLVREDLEFQERLLDYEEMEVEDLLLDVQSHG